MSNTSRVTTNELRDALGVTYQIAERIKKDYNKIKKHINIK